MRLILIGLSMGIGFWQCMPELLTKKHWQIIIILLVILIIIQLLNFYLKIFLKQALLNGIEKKFSKCFKNTVINNFIHYFSLFLVFFICGFLFSAWRAELRMAKILPFEYEGRAITLVGIIKGIPIIRSDNVNFTMLVKSTSPNIKYFPKKVSLTWYPEKNFATHVLLPPLITAIDRYSSRDQINQYLKRLISTDKKHLDKSKPFFLHKNKGESLSLLLAKHDVELAKKEIANFNKEKELSKFEAGQIWQMKVRLKKPRTVANFGSFDWESRFLHQNIRARGYIIDKPKPHYLGNYLEASFRRFFLEKIISDEQLKASFISKQWLLFKAYIQSIQLKIDWYRSSIAKNILQNFPNSPYAGVVVALAIGEQNKLDFKIREILSITGTSHLLAISGLHVGLVSGIVSIIISFIWRHIYWRGFSLCLLIPAQRVAAFSGIVTAIIYVALAGFGIPAQRALWMMVVVFTAYSLNRCVPVTVVLSWALFLVLLIDPWAPLTIGFWLSFAAVIIISIVIFQDQLKRKKELYPSQTKNYFDKFRSGINKFGLVARVQLALSCALAPLTVYWFNKLSIISPIANAFAIPLVSFFIVPLVLLGALIPAPFDIWLLKAANHLIGLLMGFLTKFADLGIAGINWIKPPLFIVVITACGATCAALPIALKWRILGLGSCLPFLWYRHEILPYGEFRLTAMDVGQGMAVLVETRHHRFVFDTGPTLGKSDSGERFILPYLKNLGIKQLDGLMVSHNHSDHTGGAATLLLATSVKNFFASLPPDHFLWTIAAYRKTKNFNCIAGKTWHWDNVSFEILWPKADIFNPQNILQKHSINGTSCVLKIKTKYVAALLPGDLESKQEHILLSSHYQNNLPEIKLNSVMSKITVPSEKLLFIEENKKAKLTSSDNAIDGQINQPLFKSKLKADILIAPHHGSNTSSTLNFIRQVMPAHVIFQMGYKNRFRHPHPNVYKRYKKLGAKLYRNDYDGAVRLTTKQKKIKVERYREQYRRYWHEYFENETIK